MSANVRKVRLSVTTNAPIQPPIPSIVVVVPNPVLSVNIVWAALVSQTAETMPAYAAQRAVRIVREFCVVVELASPNASTYKIVHKIAEHAGMLALWD